MNNTAGKIGSDGGWPSRGQCRKEPLSEGVATEKGQRMNRGGQRALGPRRGAPGEWALRLQAPKDPGRREASTAPGPCGARALCLSSVGRRRCVSEPPAPEPPMR